MKQKTLFLTSLVLIYLISQIGYICFFTEERILFSDTAFQLYKLINEGYPVMMTDRWPLVSQRFFPYLLLLIEAPLSTLIYAYSINIFLIEAAILAVLLIKRSYAYALLWLMILLMGRVETIFWCPSDLLIGIGLSLILFSISDRQEPKFWKLILWAIPLLFCHPLVIFPVLFKGVFDLIISKKPSSSRILFFGTLFIFWVVRNVFVSHWYVSAKRSSLLGYLKTYTWRFWELESNAQFMKECATQYWPLVILLLVTSIYQCYTKRYLAWAFSISFTLLYVQLVNYSNAVSAPSYYREASYIAMVFFILYPIKNDLLTKNYLDRWKWLLWSVVLLNIGNTIHHSSTFSTHISELKSLIASQKCDKKLIKKGFEGPMQWGLPVETLLLSSIYGESKTIKQSSDQDFNEKNIFLEPFGQIEIELLNQRYFTLDDKTSYCSQYAEHNAIKN